MICAPRLVETMGHATALQTVPSWEVSRPEPAPRDSESAVYVSSQKILVIQGSNERAGDSSPRNL